MLFQTIIFNFYIDFGKNLRFGAQIWGKNKKINPGKKRHLGRKKTSQAKKAFWGKKNELHIPEGVKFRWRK